MSFIKQTYSVLLHFAQSVFPPLYYFIYYLLTHLPQVVHQWSTHYISSTAPMIRTQWATNILVLVMVTEKYLHFFPCDIILYIFFH